MYGYLQHVALRVARHVKVLPARSKSMAEVGLAGVYDKTLVGLSRTSGGFTGLMDSWVFEDNVGRSCSVIPWPVVPGTVAGSTVLRFGSPTPLNLRIPVARTTTRAQIQAPNPEPCK